MAVDKELRVGVMPILPLSESRQRRRLLDRIAELKFDHVTLADHVALTSGVGYDALIAASSILSGENALPVYVGLYVLPLRHPVVVARQVADISTLAPGRLTLAVGVGGDDRHEMEVAGIDPLKRGARMEEALPILRQLLTGRSTSASGEHFTIAQAIVRPAPVPPVPVLVGGRSHAALVRAGRYGDGWLGIWVSARRYREALSVVNESAVAVGRTGVPWRHGLNLWCGIGRTNSAAIEGLARAMPGDFGRLARWCPCGPPPLIAAYLRPYISAGCVDINLVPRGYDMDAQLEGAAEVRRLLHEEHSWGNL